MKCDRKKCNNTLGKMRFITRIGGTKKTLCCYPCYLKAIGFKKVENVVYYRRAK